MKNFFFTFFVAISVFMNAQKETKFSIIPSVGYAWRTAKTPDGLSQDMKDYIKGIKSGVNFDVSAYFNVKNDFGIGLKYSNYSASSEGKITVQDIDGQYITGLVKTKDNITFVGPAIMTSNFSRETKHKYFFDLGLGIISYTTKTESVKGTGSNLGIDANLAYQYELSRQILIGPKLGFSAGTLSKMQFNGQTVKFEDDQKEGLGRVSLSFAATLRF